MQLRKLKQQIEKQILNIFPTIPKINITAYIHHHPSLSPIDFVVHFLEIAEPSRKPLDIQSNFLIAQARQILQHKKLEESNLISDEKGKLSLLSQKEQSERLEIQKLILSFEPNETSLNLGKRIFKAIGKLRIQKKRPAFQEEDYMKRLANTFANELNKGYISIDDDDNWKKWFETHPDSCILTDRNFCCGFIPQVVDPLHSLTSIIQQDKDMRQVLFSSSRFCGIGISVSKHFSVFFAIFISNRK